jgi:hypothetical protein
VELEYRFDLCHFSFLPQQGNQSIDVLVVILDNLRVFEKDLFLLSVAGFVLQKGCRKLTENVGILSHYYTCLDVFLFLLWL